MAYQKDEKVNLVKDAQLWRPKKGLLNFLNWKSFTGEDNLLVLCDEKGKTTGYLEMLTILGKDLDFIYGSGSEGTSGIIRDFHSLLRSFLTDFDILITQMTADTTVQQKSWAGELYRLEQSLRTMDAGSTAYEQALIRRKIIKQQLSKARFVEEAIHHEAYAAFIYGETESETRRLREIFRNAGGSSLDTRLMSLKQKEFILSILQDPTRQLKGGTN